MDEFGIRRQPQTHMKTTENTYLGFYFYVLRGRIWVWVYVVRTLCSTISHFVTLCAMRYTGGIVTGIGLSRILFLQVLTATFIHFLNGSHYGDAKDISMDFLSELNNVAMLVHNDNMCDAVVCVHRRNVL